MERGFQKGPGGFMTGVSAVFWGFRQLLADPGLRRLAVTPMIITVVLYTVGMSSVIIVTPRILGDFRPEDPESWWMWLWWSAVVVAVVLSIGLAALLFTAVAEAVGGPFYDKMAGKILGAHGVPTSEPGFVAGTFPDLARSFGLALAAALCWGLGFIPVIGIAFWVLGVGIAWLGLGAGAVNSSLLMTGYRFGGRLRHFVRYLPTVLGLGSVVWLAMLVPLLGLLAIPSSVVGASRLHAARPQPEP